MLAAWDSSPEGLSLSGGGMEHGWWAGVVRCAGRAVQASPGSLDIILGSSRDAGEVSLVGRLQPQGPAGGDARAVDWRRAREGGEPWGCCPRA